MKVRTCLVLLCSPALTAAHPGNGIVALSDHSVFTGDAAHSSLWRFDKGKAPYRIASGFHCHWVTLGLDGRLYSETLSQRSGTWTDTVDKMDSHGLHPSEVAHGKEGVFGIFAVGRSGEIVHQSGAAIVAWSGGRESPFRASGRVEEGAPPLGSVKAFAWGPNDTLYFCDGNYVRKVGTDGVVRLAAKVEGPVTAALYAGPNNAVRIWGLTVDAQGRVFVAVPSNGQVVRIDKDGSKHVVAHSDGDWAATGVAVFGGTVFLLECRTQGNVNDGPRIRAVRTGGRIESLGEAK